MRLANLDVARNRCFSAHICNVTPCSLKSCTRKLVAMTSCAILSMIKTFHVGTGAIEVLDDDPPAPAPVALDATGVEFSDKSDKSDATWWSRSVLVALIAR